MIRNILRIAIVLAVVYATSSSAFNCITDTECGCILDCLE